MEVILPTFLSINYYNLFTFQCVTLIAWYYILYKHTNMLDKEFIKISPKTRLIFDI